MERRPAETYIDACRHRTGPSWAVAPLPFKLYRNCVRIPLSGATLAALSTESDDRPTCSLGLLLHEMYGMVRAPVDFASPAPGRPVASGGACFPGELYLLVHGEPGLAPGLYHYDPLHHTLDFLRAGQFQSALYHALARPPERLPTYTLLYSSLFWKNAFRYQEFSYRLQGLDIGCLLAQTQVVSECSGLRPMLHLRFLDEQLNQLLGFNPLEESIYAVATLEEDAVEVGTASLSRQVLEVSTASEFPRTFEQYEPLSRWPLLEAVHRASSIQTLEELHERKTLPTLPLPASASDLVIRLPHVASLYPGEKATYRRSAQPWEYRARKLTLAQLACLLQAAASGYRGDLDGEVPRLSHTLLYCLINQVDEVPPGIYAYQPERHLLQQITSGDFTRQFQAVQADQWWDMAHVSLALIPVGNYAQGFVAYGDRWYRMQNMEAGLCVQRLYLAATLNNLACRALLSYDDAHLDALLRLPANYTSLIQVFISPRDLNRPPRKEETLWIRW